MMQNLFFLASLVVSSSCIHIDSKDQIIPIGSFGLGPGALLSGLVRVAKASDADDQLPRSVIFLTPQQERTYWMTTESAVADVNRPAFARLFLRPHEDTELAVHGLDEAPVLLNAYLHNPLTNSEIVHSQADTGVWSWFEEEKQLKERGPQHVVCQVTLELQQKDGTHLEYQYRHLPDAQGILAVVAVILVAVYEGLMLTVWRSAVTQLHLIYVFAGLSFSGYLFLASSGSAALQEDASTSAWRYKYLPEYAEKIFDAAEMAVFLMTAIGYKVVRRSMTRPEWRLVTALLTVMVYVGFFEVGCEDTSEGCGGYRLSRVIVSALAFLIVIIGANFHLASLSAQVPESALNNVGKLYRLREAYAKFRNIFLIYILQPTAALYYRLSVLDWTDDWAFVTFFWTLRGSLLLAMLWTFRPQIRNMKVFDLIAFRR